MKAGLTIEELASEIMRQKDAKADYIVNTARLSMENYGTDLVLRVLGDDDVDRIEPLDIADTAIVRLAPVWVSLQNITEKCYPNIRIFW